MPLHISGEPTAGKVGVSYCFTPAVDLSGSDKLPTFRLTPVPPAGMMFDARTGTIHGTPKAASTRTMTLKAHRELWNGNQYAGPEEGSITFDITITD